MPSYIDKGNDIKELLFSKHPNNVKNLQSPHPTGLNLTTLGNRPSRAEPLSYTFLKPNIGQSNKISVLSACNIRILRCKIAD